MSAESATSRTRYHRSQGSGYDVQSFVSERHHYNHGLLADCKKQVTLRNSNAVPPLCAKTVVNAGESSCRWVSNAKYHYKVNPGLDSNMGRNAYLLSIEWSTTSMVYYIKSGGIVAPSSFCNA